MEETEMATLWLSVDIDTPDDDLLRLIESLTDQEKGILVEPTGNGPGLGEFVICAIALAVSTTTLANQLLDIAQKLASFRKKQQQGKPGRISIERSDGDKVEIEGYAAEDILPLLTAAMYTPQREDPQEPDDNTLSDTDEV